ncbi:putative LPS assembly protein LptD [Flagellimonas aequoris]|uniref:LPS-assembly protein LptD n=1 Tax=Flagellimonas aequoris TaxID=2306997 RepID=A0A418NDJ6_9FLAO|nr:putative LPS assembly protein LptD [Allomuricauda aequoris]RIV74420.1 LPS-assembly protein LptD [Allomuricauda aequoris]TXK08542.1 LPS-assembly protein LptD [Allomuricauda aequoris]
MQANKHLLVFLFVLLCGNAILSAQEDQITPLPIKAARDTIQAPILTTNIFDKTKATDTVEVDTVPKKQPLLLDKIKYKAKDYVKLSQKDNKIYLYDEAEIYYQDTELKAGVIVMDYVKNEVYAGRMKDSLGNYSQLPYFKQGDNEVRPDSIRFNFDTQKALIWNSRTEQQAGLGQLGSDAMKVYAQVTKKENDSVYFLSEGKLTTSKDTVDPDYYIRVRKAKFVPKKKIIAGYSNMYIVDVPTPVALPFAYFPLTTGRAPGLIFPTFGNDPNRGYFIQNGGYYLPISDYVDLSVTGDYYTNGSYGLMGQSIYTKRYKFNGSIRISYENLIRSQKGFTDYSRTSNYNIRISHSQDTKASPNSRFSASVNLGSSQYYTNSLNQVNRNNSQTNTFASSISYSKTFPAYPSVNTSLTLSHTQNSRTQIINMSLPTFQASMERIYPFVKRDEVKKGIFENINFQYDVNAQNSITTTEEDFFTSKMFDEAKVGARHRLPIATNFKVAKYFSVSLSGTYEDIWTLETIRRQYNADEERVVTDTIPGFDRFNRYSLGTSIGTTLYGTWNFGEGKKIQALRHVMRPSISYSYAPSFEQFYDTYVDGDGEDVQYTPFETSLYGRPSLSRGSSVSFSLQNTLEAKVRDKDSTATEPKKVSILSNLTLSTSYNFEADSLKLSPVSLSGATEIIKNVPINFAATFDPYAIDNSGRRINTLNIKNGGGLARLTSARLNTGFSLNSEMFQKGGAKKKDDKEQETPDYGANPFEVEGARTGDRHFNKDGEDDNEEVPLYNTKLPWDARFTYVATYNNSNRQSEITNHSLMFSGNIQLSPKWEVGFNSGYDLKNKGFADTRFAFKRDLGSFKLSFDWTPFGRYERWYFFIGIKSSILSDLKWENRSQPFSNR